MERNPIPSPEESPTEETTSSEHRGRQLTVDQMEEFRRRVGKEMRLAAQRAQPASQLTTPGIRQGTNRKSHRQGPSAGREGY